MLLEEDKRLDRRFWDPRYDAVAFKKLGAMQRYKTIFEFHKCVEKHLRTELYKDNNGLGELTKQAPEGLSDEQHQARIVNIKMQGDADFANEQLAEFYPEAYRRRTMTIEDAKRGWLSFVTYDFYSMGVTYCVRDVCVGGWAAVQTGGSSSSRALLACITGEDFM